MKILRLELNFPKMSSFDFLSICYCLLCLQFVGLLSASRNLQVPLGVNYQHSIRWQMFLPKTHQTSVSRERRWANTREVSNQCQPLHFSYLTIYTFINSYYNIICPLFINILCIILIKYSNNSTNCLMFVEAICKPIWFLLDTLAPLLKLYINVLLNFSL